MGTLSHYFTCHNLQPLCVMKVNIFSLVLVGVALSSSTSKASKKKGLCIPPGKNFHCGDLEAFSHVSWWYNWHTQPNHVDEDKCTCDTAPDCGPEPDQPAFVPKIWGYHEDNPWHDDESDPVAKKSLQEVEDFVKEIIPRLEEADFVFRYSWFITRRKHWDR